MRFVLLYFLTLIVFSCSSSIESSVEIQNSSTDVNDINEKIECEDEDIPCENLSIWASEYFEEEEYEDAIDGAKQAIACNCSVDYAADIFSVLTRAYVEIGDDSEASNAINKGLSYEPENIELVELAVWNSKRMDDKDAEIENLEFLITLDNSIDNFKRLSDVYRKNRMYNDQVRIIKKWISIYPQDDIANQELKLAYNKLGKDELAIDKERCEKNPENFDYCFNYASSLAKAARFEDSLKEFIKMTKKFPSNEKLMLKTAEVYLDNYNEDEALILFKKLIRMKPDNINYVIELSKIYQDSEKFRDAHKWAKKALNISNTNATALLNYAKLFKNSVESCSDEELKLEDKAVYEIAYKYYRLAFKQGNKESKNMIEWFKSNKKSVLPTLEDWFLVDTQESQLRPIDINPDRSCYSWIEQSVDKIVSGG